MPLTIELTPDLSPKDMCVVGRTNMTLHTGIAGVVPARVWSLQSLTASVQPLVLNKPVNKSSDAEKQRDLFSSIVRPGRGRNQEVQ